MAYNKCNGLFTDVQYWSCEIKISKPLGNKRIPYLELILTGKTYIKLVEIQRFNKNLNILISKYFSFIEIRLKYIASL